MLVFCAAMIFQWVPRRSITSVISVLRTWPGARLSPWSSVLTWARTTPGPRPQASSSFSAHRDDGCFSLSHKRIPTKMISTKAPAGSA